MASHVNGEQSTSKDEPKHRDSIRSTGSKKTKTKGQDCREFLRFLYNSETKEFCGRSCASWAKISAFYLILYAALCGFFAMCVTAFLAACIDDSRPRLLGYESMLQLNPALGFRPQPDPETTFIRLSRNKTNENKQYLQDLNDYLKQYDMAKQQADQLLDCERLGVVANHTVACIFNTSLIPAECTNEQQFGIPSGNPCVLVKMNRIYGWLPGNKDNSTELEDIKLTCSGVNEGDQENIGTVEYYPGNIFPKRYYPYVRQKGYVSPFVMVQFRNITKFTLVMVTCRLHGNGVRYDPVYQEGGVRFELLID